MIRRSVRLFLCARPFTRVSVFSTKKPGPWQELVIIFNILRCVIVYFGAPRASLGGTLGVHIYLQLHR